jgi:hypothetical protein
MEMRRLEVELSAEIKRRTEMNKSTQNWFEEELTKIDKTFHALLETRAEKTTVRLEQLNIRIDKIDAR